MKQQLKQLWIGLVLAAGGLTASADIVYDNSSVRSHPERLPQRNYEYGEEIILAGNGTWVMTNFQFEYFGFGPDFQNGNAKIYLRIYKNDGPVDINGAQTPKTIIYDTGFTQVFSTPSAGKVLEFHNLHIPVPKNFTWTVEFGGLTQGSFGGLQFGGLDLYQFPTVGQTYDDYWEKTGVGPGGWELRKANPADHLPINFGCRVSATYNGPPAITQQPVSTSVDCTHDTTVQFKVNAIGTAPLTYQWFKDGSPLAGKTATTLTVPNVGVADLGSYTVKVTNGQGNQMSDQAVLSLTGIPCLKIRKGPARDEVTVAWSQVPGPQWRLQHTFSVTPPAWENTLLTPTLKNGEYSVIIGIQKQKYFRVVNP